MLRDLTRAFVESGHEVQVLTGFPNYPAGVLYPGYALRPWQEEWIDRVQVTRVCLYPDHSSSAARRALNFLSFAVSSATIGLLKARRADVVHLIHPITAGVTARLLSTRFGIPFTMEVPDLWPETLVTTGMIKSRLLVHAIGGFAHWVYSKAAAIRVISEGFRENLIRKGVPREKLQVIPNWCDIERHRPVERDPAVGRELGLAGYFNVVHAGAMGPAQHLETVLDAADLLRDLSDVRFVLVGEGICRQRLQETVITRNLTNVSFLSNRREDEMPPLLAWADVLLINLRRDPLFSITIPHKTYTYLASGKPILAAVEGEVAELISRLDAGVGCRSEDPESLARAVRKLRAMSIEERSQLGERGRAAAEGEFEKGRVLGKLVQMVCEVGSNREAIA
jgi:glycosyltransferase involved in cell wall biosynthesis